MLRRLFSNAIQKASLAPVDADRLTKAAKREIETLRFAPMVPLQPPPAQNDDLLQNLCGGVERELRAAGYLR